MSDGTRHEERVATIQPSGWLLALIAAAIVGCSAPRPPDVIVYLVDTLRPDHLGIYGYARRTSPNLAEFARDAVVFANTYTPASWTKPATASLLTGLLPRRHGAITLSDRLPSRIRTAAERLKALGYRTASFVTNPNVIALWGFDQGVDDFRDLRTHNRPAKADEVVRIVLDSLAGSGTKPLFLYIHTIEPHGPNKPPEPFRSLWPRLTSEKTNHPKYVRSTTNPDVVHDVIAAYDGEIAFNDSQFGELIRGLKRSGRYDNSLIIYVADHGEEIQDHGFGGHGHTLYEELVRVPLVIKYPGGRNAGKRIVERVSLLDVLPTILGEVGQRAASGLDGIDLTPLVQGAATVPNRNFLLDLETQPRSAGVNVLRGVLVGRMKYIERLEPRHETQLFDLAADSREQTNLAASDPDGAARLSHLLDTLTAEVQGGIHLRVVNEGDRIARSFSGRFRTSGRFVDPTSWQFEPEDRLTPSSDGHTLEFEVRCVNQENRSDRTPRRFVDEDGIAFRVDPPDAKVVLEALQAPGFTAARLFVGTARVAVESLPLEIRPHDPRFAAESLSALLPASSEKSVEAPGGAYLVVVPYAAREAAAVDAETTGRLRALGYVQ
jgi:arylsulfatase A-like enzyme